MKIETSIIAAGFVMVEDKKYSKMQEKANTLGVINFPSMCSLLKHPP